MILARLSYLHRLVNDCVDHVDASSRHMWAPTLMVYNGEADVDNSSYNEQIFSGLSSCQNRRSYARLRFDLSTSESEPESEAEQNKLD